MPWQCGKVLVWDATCPDTLAPSHSALATREAGAVAEDAEHKKTKVHAPVTILSLRSICCGDFEGIQEGCSQLVQRQRMSITEDDMAHQHFIQRISVAVQRGNAASVLGCALVRGEG